MNVDMPQRMCDGCGRDCTTACETRIDYLRLNYSDRPPEYVVKQLRTYCPACQKLAPKPSVTDLY